MQQYSNGSEQVTIGLDLGDRMSYFKMLDQEGEVLEEGRVATTSGALQKKVGGMQRARIALEVGSRRRG